MAERKLGHQEQTWVLVAMSMVLMLLTMDFFGVTVALPAIGDDLGTSTAGLEWVANAYLLGFAAPLIAVGRLGDLIGRRRVVMLGTGLFITASAVCGLAVDAPMLIAARAVQGIGAAAIFSTTLSIVSNAFPPERRSLGIGVWSGVGATGQAAGPILAGLLTASLSWRWFFFVNVPIGLAAIVITHLKVAESRDTTASRHIDTTGFALVTLALVLIIFGLQQSTSLGWESPVVLGALGLGVVAAGAFAWVESHQRDPLVEFGLFRTPAFMGAAGIAFVGNFAFSVAMFFPTLYLQNILDLGPLATGGIFLIFAIPFASLSPVSGPLGRRYGERLLMALGLVGTAASFVCFILLGPDSGWWLIGLAFAVQGACQAFVYNLSTSVGMDAMSTDKAGVAAGVLNASRISAMAVGLAVAGALFRPVEQATIADELTARGATLSAEQTEITNLLSGSGAATDTISSLLTPEQADQARQIATDAFLAGFRAVSIMVLVLVLASLPLCLLGRNRATPGAESGLVHPHGHWARPHLHRPRTSASA